MHPKKFINTTILRHDTMKISELLKKLLDSDCTMIRHGANHDIWYSPITGKKFPVPRHASKEVTSGTLKDISKKSGIEL